MGAFRHVQHVNMSDKKHRPNVSIVVHPSAGPNDGFLSLVARSPTKCGISGGAALVANFGALFDPSKKLPFALDGSPAKKFKSAIELIFEAQTRKYEEDDDNDTGTGSAPQNMEEERNGDADKAAKVG